MNDSWMRMIAASLLALAVAGCGRTGNGDADGGAWTTVATLRSGDAHWQNMEGLLVSEPFDAAGDVQVVMEMPNGGPMDGVIAMIIPSDQATDARALMAAVRQGQTVMMVGAAPTQAVTGLDGTYVLVNSVPSPHAWSLEIQTRFTKD